MPDVSVSSGVLTVTTPHPMSEVHYIVSHTVVLKGGVFLDRKTFTYTDQPVSTHTLPAGYKGEVLITSTLQPARFLAKNRYGLSFNMLARARRAVYHSGHAPLAQSDRARDF